MRKDSNALVTSKNILNVLFKDELKGQIIFYPSRFREIFKSLDDDNEFKEFLLIEKGTVT